MSDKKYPTSNSDSSVDKQVPDDKVESAADNVATETDQRRRAVRNILTGSGIVAGAATSGKWSKPLVDAVVLPAHAQTSAMVMLVGNVNVSPLSNVPQQNADSVLDFFIGSAYANGGPNLSGACMTMAVDGASFDLSLEFAANPTIQLSGTVSGNTISGTGSGITVSGTLNLQNDPPMASGTVSNVDGAFGFSLDTSQSACTPISATTTLAPTTMAPTTTCMPGYMLDQGGYCVPGPEPEPQETRAPTTSPAPTTTPQPGD